jgi:hypothetical protein
MVGNVFGPAAGRAWASPSASRMSALALAKRASGSFAIPRAISALSPSALG